MAGWQLHPHLINDSRADRRWEDSTTSLSDDDSPGSWGMPTFHDAMSTTVRTMVYRRSSTLESSPITEASSDEQDEYNTSESDQVRGLAKVSPQSSPMHLPLDIFPVKVEGRAKTACRYFTEVYGPATFRRPHFHGEAEDLSLLQDWTPFLLSNKITFAALQANALIHFDLADHGLQGPSPRSRKAYDLAIRLFRKHLLSASDKKSDLVISTMLLLSAFDNLSSNLDGAWMHVKAMNDVIRQRGGPKQLGFDGWLATACDSFTVHTACQQELVRLNGSASPSYEKLKPPVLPFSPEICAQLARLPPAFEELCMRDCLMAPVLGVLSDVAAFIDATKPDEGHWLQELSPELVDANYANATKCFILLQNPQLPLQDQLILMALQAHCALIDRTERGRFLNLAYLQIHTVLLPMSLYSGQSQNLQWLTWVGMTMLASSHTDSLTWALGTRILEQQRFQNSWAQRLEICRKFFWNDDFSIMVLQKLQYQRNNPSMAGGKFSYISY